MILKQVQLSRSSEHGAYEEIYWIDGELARKGKRVVGEDGRVWEVVAVYGSKTIENLEREHRTWRRFQDVLDGG